MGSAVRMGRRKSHPGFADAPGVSRTSSQPSFAAVVVRGALSSGAFRHYLSGPAAVETAGEEIAATHADGRPHRDSMRIDKIAQFRFQMNPVIPHALEPLSRADPELAVRVAERLARKAVDAGPGAARPACL